MPTLLFPILTPLFLPPSCVSLSYFILAVPMRKCLGKHSCISSPFPIAILNGTFFFHSVKAINNWTRSAIKQILLLPHLISYELMKHNCQVYGVCRFIVFVWGPYINDWDSETNCFTIIQLYHMLYIETTSAEVTFIMSWSMCRLRSYIAKALHLYVHTYTRITRVLAYEYTRVIIVIY